MDNFYVYIATSKKNGVLYVGMTNSLERRVLEHKSRAVKSFTLRYNVGLLIYFEGHSTYKEAVTRELQIKKWKRSWKIRLIEEENIDWKDLAEDWYD